MAESSKKSCEWEFKNKLDKEEIRVNVLNDPVIGGSLNEVLDAHESPIRTRSEEPATQVGKRSWQLTLMMKWQSLKC